MLRKLRAGKSETTAGASVADLKAVLADGLGKLVPVTPGEVTGLLRRLASVAGPDDLGALGVEWGWDEPGECTHTDYLLGEEQEGDPGGHAGIVVQALSDFLGRLESEVSEADCTLAYVGFRPPADVLPGARDLRSPQEGLHMFCNRVWQSMTDDEEAAAADAGKCFWAMLYCQKWIDPDSAD